MEIENSSENRFSLIELKKIHQQLVENKNVNENNQSMVIEILRIIAEMVVYGDNKSELLFDFFCEKNMLSLFLQIMWVEQGCPNAVHIQILQTLSILISCVRNETSLYYLLSNNYINEILTFPHDFDSDESLCAHFASFMKSLSLRLNVQTVQFFFIEDSGAFPILAKAIELLPSNDPMIRISSQSTILNIYKVEDARARDYALQEKVMHDLFVQIAKLMSTQLASIMNTNSLYIGVSADSVEDSVEKLELKLDDTLIAIEDWFYYLQDLLNLKIEVLRRALINSLLNDFIYPEILSALFNRGSLSKNEPSRNSKDTPGYHYVDLKLSTGIVYLTQMLRIVSDPLFHISLMIVLFHPLSHESRNLTIKALYKDKLRKNGFSSNETPSFQYKNEVILSELSRESSARSLLTENFEKSPTDILKNHENIQESIDNLSLENDTLDNVKIEANSFIQNEFRLEFLKLFSPDNQKLTLICLYLSYLLMDALHNYIYDEFEEDIKSSTLEFKSVLSLLQFFESLSILPSKDIDFKTMIDESQVDLFFEKVHERSIDLIRDCEIISNYVDEYDQLRSNRKNKPQEKVLNGTVNVSCGKDERLIVQEEDLNKGTGNEENEEKIWKKKKKRSKKAFSVEPDMLSLNVIFKINQTYHENIGKNSVAPFVSKLCQIIQEPWKYSLTILQVSSHILYLLSILLNNSKLSNQSEERNDNDARNPLEKEILHKLVEEIRVACRISAHKLLNRIQDPHSEIALNLLKEEINRYSNRSWKSSIKKMVQDILLFLPSTPSNIQRMGVDFDVPVSHNEKFRRDIQAFILFRALYTSTLQYLDPTFNESVINDDFCSNITDREFLGIDEVNLIPVNLVEGSQYDMRGKRFLESYLLRPFTNDELKNRNSSPSSSLAMWSSSIFSFGGIKRNSGNKFPGLNGDIPTSLSNCPSSPTRDGSKLKGQIIEGPNGTKYLKQKVLFVQDQNLLILVMHDKSEVKSNFKVFVVASLLYTDAQIDSNDNKKFKIFVRSWKKMNNMEKCDPDLSLIQSEGSANSKGARASTPLKHSESFLKKDTEKSSFWFINIAMDNSQACKLIVQHIETRKKIIFQEKMSKFENILSLWASDEFIVKEN